MFAGFDDVEHLDGGLDGGLRLIGVEGTRAVYLVAVHPGDACLHEGVGASAGRNADDVVGEPREGAFELVLVDVAHGAHEGVVHTVADGRFFIYLPVDFELHACHRLEAVGGGDEVAEEPYAGFGCGVLEDVGDDVWEVFLGDELFLVAEFDYTLRHAPCLLGRKFEAEFFEILENVGLAGVLAEGVLALASETFGKEVVAVEIVLVVAVGMYAGHLREDALADDGLVWGNGYAGIALYDTADFVQLVLADIRRCTEMVLEYGLHARERCIAGTFAQAVDGGVDASASAEDGGEDVGDGEVVVVVGMEIEPQAGETSDHLAHVIHHFEGVEHSQCVGKHETLDSAVLERLDKVEDVVGRILHSVAPILKVEVDGDAQL